MAKKSKRNYVVEGQLCDTIKSIPLDEREAVKMANTTRRKIPGAKVIIKRA